MSVWYRPMFNLIELICDKTIRNKDFNSDEWSIYEGEQLIRCGEMIIREIKRKKK